MIEVPGYTIQKQIGQGGMASVYLAIQRSLGRYVVLKVLDAGGPEGSDALTERFLSEGRIIASLNHPNIITIHDIGIADDMCYLSMEYLQGGDLKERLKSPISTDNALDYLSQISAALSVAHQHGVIHRDVKPANILFKEDDTPVLTDFGIAKQIDTDYDLTMTGVFMGSPNYVSPEQAEGIKLDGRSDIYSLGCIFYEMLTGRKLYQAQSVVNIIIQHQQAPIPQLPEGLQAYQPLLDQMLAKDREQRFPDAESLVMEIEILKRKQRPGDILLDLNITGPGKIVAQNREKRAKQILLSLLLLGLVLFSSLKYIEIKIKDTSVNLNEITTDTVLNGNGSPAPPGPETTTAAPQVKGEPDGAASESLPVSDEIVKALTFLGKQSLEEYKLTYPPKDNAYYYFSRLLELDPGNQTAMDGIAAIADRYAVLAEQSLLKNESQKTITYINLGLRINPLNESLLSLKSLAKSTQETSLLESLKNFFSNKK